MELGKTDEMQGVIETQLAAVDKAVQGFCTIGKAYLGACSASQLITELTDEAVRAALQTRVETLESRADMLNQFLSKATEIHFIMSRK